MRLWDIRGPWTARAPPSPMGMASPRGARAAIVDVIADSLVGIWE